MLQIGNNEIIIAIVAGTFMLMLLGVFILTFIFFYQRKRKSHFLEKEQIKNVYQKELLKSQLEIQEQTLKNISQEIHDNIGQTLSLAKLNLNTINDSDPGRTANKIASSKELVSKAILDLRSLSKTMHTDTILQAGLQKALEIEIQIVGRSADMQTALEISGIPFNMEQQKELIIFRTTQEALNNAIKHSGAKTLTVGVHYRETTLEVCITDNGTGFEPTNITNSGEGGSGLRNMHNRMQLIGGTLEIFACKPQGTMIQLNIPK